jgi:hypothetical protein
MKLMAPAIGRPAFLAITSRVEHKTGADITEADWDAFYEFYQDTSARKWGRPYLNRTFFSLIGARMPERILLVIAKNAGRPIAGAINFRDVGAGLVLDRDALAQSLPPLALDRLALARGQRPEKIVEAGIVLVLPVELLVDAGQHPEGFGLLGLTRAGEGLQVSVPFTPVTGPRFLIAPGEDPDTAAAALVAGLRALRAETEASSIHVTFARAREAEQAEALGMNGTLTWSLG